MRYVVIAFSAALALPAGAAPSPLDASAPVPPLTYKSPFATYSGLGDVEVKSWREVNDTVRDVGGHAGVMSSSSRGPQAPASTPSTKAARP